MMDNEGVRLHCLAKPGATEGFPFAKLPGGDQVLVFKVMNKMFALVDLEAVPSRVSLKCDPARAAELREEYEGVEPADHMDKRHWISVVLDGSLPAALVRESIDHSYSLVVAKLRRADRELLDDKS